MITIKKTSIVLTTLLFSLIAMGGEKMVTCDYQLGGSSGSFEVESGAVTAMLDLENEAKVLHHSAGKNVLAWLQKESSQEAGSVLVIERTKESAGVVSLLYGSIKDGEYTDIETSAWFLSLNEKLDFGPFSCSVK